MSDEQRATSDGRRPAEFPPGVARPGPVLSRRDFVRLLGASAALAGVYGCSRRPDELILPYVHQPPELTPGVPQYYATAMTLDGLATGLLVESHDGRPTKVEGNPDHPASLGAAGVHEQASVLQLYDPHRSRHVRHGAQQADWDAVARLLAPVALGQRVGARGEGLRLLLEPTASPLTVALLARVRERWPAAGVHVHAPFAAPDDGDALLPLPDLTRADVVLALDADFLASGPFHLRWAHDWAVRRGAGGGPSRLYVVESGFTPTGATADHRLAVRPGELETVAAALLAGVRAARGVTSAPTAPTTADEATTAWLRAAARDLAAAAGRCVVVAGPRQSATVRLLARALNAELGNEGRTMWYVRSPLLGAGDASVGSLADLAAARDVDTLLVLGGNPVYDAPADVDVAGLLRRVPNTVHLGLYEDETARACAWHVPALHYLERWGDARAYDGTASLVQPLVAPLFGGHCADELLALVAGEATPRAHDLLQTHWRGRAGDRASGFDAFWREALRRGVIADSAAPRAASAPVPAVVPPPAAPPRAAAGTLEVVLAPCPKVHDGRFADNAWLQELPEPMTTLTWGNAAQLSPATAARLGVESGDELALGAGGRTVRVPAIVVPGVADGVAVLHAGYGRDGAEETARGVGVRAQGLFPRAARYALAGVTVARTGAHHELALTQPHWRLHGREPVRVVAPGQPVAREDAAGGTRRRALPLYERQPGAPHQWAMTIDLDRCTGCGACMVACQAENNVPVVGPEGVRDGREMHWLRIDRYYADAATDAAAAAPAGPLSVAQPMLCQHCEDAPCEYVCPVEATVHSSDGLNEMVYNRCVGTRFCSNNCPYKVRRFNWFDYNRDLGDVEALQRNPDVTVRERGVMEKCTFCVQRIREAEIRASVEGRTLGPNEVTTACAQACPTRAIVFGSLTGAGSEVARLREDPRAYAVLDELGTEPRVRYLARVRNANPALAASRAPSASEAAT
ncbi:MAG TPA: 4Fe-4S dicluster domain-containing protein [Gemmatimonadaceae bacterium]|nr:4Fe-4S dicluster domain-containing protein [Gemmatimonadaceae bacterium]